MRFQPIEFQETKGAAAILHVVQYFLEMPAYPLPKFPIPVELDFGYLGQREMTLTLGGRARPVGVGIHYPGSGQYLAKYSVYGKVGVADPVHDIDPVEYLDDGAYGSVEQRQRAFARWIGHGAFFGGYVRLYHDGRVDTQAEVAIMTDRQERRAFRRSSGRELFEEHNLQTFAQQTPSPESVALPRQI